MVKIALSSCFMYPDSTRVVFGKKSLSYMENDMVRFLASKDVMPILIPDLDNDLLDLYMNEVQGLVLQGGSDMSPQSYGEEPIDPKRWPGDLHRDQYEFKLIEKAIARKIPIFGICRGFQVLNCYFGGTLYQDLNTQTETQVEHRHADKYDNVHHAVKLKENGLLSKLYNKNQLCVNSVHHQGVKDLAQDLQQEAICPEDLFIEAFSHKNLPIFGVQWHPEFNHTLDGTVDSAMPLLRYFLDQLEK